MNLATSYMGFELSNPLVPGASPLVDNLDTVRRLEDAGAPMIVMHSLFEEQLVREELAVTRSIETPKDSFAEALSYLPEPEEFTLGPDEYLEQVRRLKAAVAIPVIGSLNGTTEGGWLRYARLIEQAGADGLELNLYELAIDTEETGAEVERRGLAVVRAVKESVRIPVAVKLSSFYSSIANYARQLDEAGADALVLFNRFYQPDIDVEQQELLRVYLSSPAELLLRLRWIGALSGRVRPSLAATGGVQTAVDVIKAVMAGAHVTQMVSALLRHGPEHLRQVRRDLERWLEEHECGSLRQIQGSMSLQRCPDPAAYRRANYIRLLQSWQVDEML
ncbi:MAG TPA: dihydroorotate dehydrogenase-like protein [Gemmataceae bacterium]|nr:dihydroorotate dehydrogenase-like protein [Gemmataceae bacterium]